MKITMLGTGAALPDPDRAQSAVLLTLDNGRNYLFDCGKGATRQMVRGNIDPASVGFVLLTHLHHDHICDYPYFVISSWMLNKTGTPLVLGPKGTQHFVNHILGDAPHRADSCAHSTFVSHRENREVTSPEVREVSPGLAYDDGHVKVTVDRIAHLPQDTGECFGVRIEAEGKVVAFSGNTAPCDAMVRLGQDADLLIHECTFPESFVAHRAKTGTGAYAHTSPTELGKLATRARAKSLVATHFGHFDATNPVLKLAAAQDLPPELTGTDLLGEVVADIGKNYSGPLRLAHDLMHIDL